MAEGVRKKGSRLHRVCDSGQKPGAALPVCLPREPSVVGTFCFLMVEAVCVCVCLSVCVCVCVCFVYPHKQPCTCQLPTSPKRGSNSWPDTQGHLQRTEPEGTVISVPTLWDRHKISSAYLGC